MTRAPAAALGAVLALALGWAASAVPAQQTTETPGAEPAPAESPVESIVDEIVDAVPEVGPTDTAEEAGAGDGADGGEAEGESPGEEPADGSVPAPTFAATEGAAEGAGVPQISSGVLDAEDYADWARTVERAETMVSGSAGSNFGLDRLRSELVTWRDRFLAAENTNAGRIETVQDRLAALDPAPEDAATEAEAVTELREALKAEIAQLSMPAVFAAEARAQAGGLITEIDTILRQREMDRLATRSLSPLLPSTWQAAGHLVAESGRQIAAEVRHTAGVVASGQHGEEVVTAMALIALGAVLLTLLRLPGSRLIRRLSVSDRRAAPALLFLVSLGFIVWPVLGVVLLAVAAEVLLVQAPVLTALAGAAPTAAIGLFVASWIGGHLFGSIPPPPVPLDFADPVRRKARRLILRLGIGSAALFMLDGLLRGLGEQASTDGEVVLRLVLNLVIAVTLYRLGKLFAQSGTGTGEDTVDDVSESSFRHALLANLGRAAMAVAIVATIAGLLGYATAAGAAIRAAIGTLEVLAVLVVLQRLVFSLYTIFTRGQRGVEEALLPVLAATILFFLSIPLLALVWGARPEDLWEIWSRFQAGLSLGETRISPSDFVFFLVVFVAGYVLTRMLQSLLRSTILPRTRLDVGARTAIVSGLGYVGIFLAALVAIVSAGIDLSSLAIVAGALSVGIGFGLQNIVSNFVSGIILLIERPISEGDWIEVGGQMGYVRDISVRSTRIETFDRTDVIVPNADLVSGQVTNWTRGNNVGRVIVPVGVAYGSDTDRVASVLREVAEGHPMVVLTPPPAVLFRGFGASSLDFEIRAILRDVNFVLNVQSEMNFEIAKKFAEAGIEIPFPQQDLWLRNPETLRQPVSHGTPAAASSSPAQGQPEEGEGEAT
ncbi:DUF3772 domain-containing protein [Wenxinia saemankumensis]|uniref:Small-conductance mechanosensitive channel n=1 Tax=Wenxinia saemankumensis TaxID=1447782 RepID=A0A1M6AU99_9RHOB|nr:DUF3772 domain-containing protein [Wenxinia saemankumensis]SHI40030.1 Small-conductance mechanosensitive channel [Wenxinia saemankumensis]